MIRVFLADGHAVVREGLKRVITDNNVIEVVGEAGDGDQLLRLIGKMQADVLLLDITLPGPAFPELMTRLGMLNLSTRLLVVSQHDELHHGLRALRAGAAGFISKCESAGELVNAIFKVFGGGTYLSDRMATELASSAVLRVSGPRHEALSGREYEILCLLAAGKGISEIAAGLRLSPKTVSTYRIRILKKLDLKTNADLIRYALRHELVS